MEQLDFIKDYKPKVSEFIEILANILYRKDLSDAAEKITSLFNNDTKNINYKKTQKVFAPLFKHYHLKSNSKSLRQHSIIFRTSQKKNSIG